MASVATSVAGTAVQPQPTQQQSSVITDRVVLRLVPRKPRKKVQWVDDVVDNENAGKRTSKKCCIFHKQRQFGDWSDDDSDAECGDSCPGPQDDESQQQQQQAATGYGVPS